MAENEDEAHENWIERNSKTISTLATVSIPVVIAIFGYFANRSLQQDELDQSYVELAIGALKAELPVNERKDCVATVSQLEDFDTAADLAEAFQDKLSVQAADSDSTGTNLPQTLFRSYALDLLLESTPATLTVPQYKALLCAETIVPLLPDQVVEPAAEADKADVTDELFNRLQDTAVDAASGCEVVIKGEVGVVGGSSLSASEEAYVVKRVALDQIPAPTGTASGSTVPASGVLYLEIEVKSKVEGDSTGADDPTVLWIRSQPNVEIQPDRETCTP